MFDEEKAKHVNGNYKLPNRCVSCGRPSLNRYCEYCAKNRKKTGGLPQMCAICKVLAECQQKPENMTSKCRICGKVDKCNMVRDGLCLDCWIKEKNKTNPLNFRTPTVDDFLTKGRNA